MKVCLCRYVFVNVFNCSSFLTYQCSFLFHIGRNQSSHKLKCNNGSNSSNGSNGSNGSSGSSGSNSDNNSTNIDANN